MKLLLAVIKWRCQSRGGLQPHKLLVNEINEAPKTIQEIATVVHWPLELDCKTLLKTVHTVDAGHINQGGIGQEDSSLLSISTSV